MSAGSPDNSRRLVRGLGLFDATMLIVGSVMGSGIFIAPALMASYIASPGLLLGLWLLGGGLTLAGALAYAELAAALPRAGGPYVYLQRAFGPLAGFLYGWTLLIAINTGFIAAVAVAFTKYLGVFFPEISENVPLLDLAGFSVNTAQAAALVVIGALTALNVRGLRTGALVQNVFTVGKVTAIAALALLAVVTAKGSTAHFFPLQDVTLGPAGASLGLFAALAVAMSKALFSYDAWTSVTFAAEEVAEPERNLPKALVFGTLAITAVYLSAVLVYLYLVPVTEMAEVPDGRIAAEAAGRMLGPAGTRFIAFAILVSTFGCANGLILSGARVVFAMARDGLFFESASSVHPRFRTPASALLLQGLVAAALTFTGTYSALLTLTAFSSLLFSTLCIVALFVLRSREPGLVRPYRVPAYPWLPALYVLVSLFLLAFILLGDPKNAGLGLALSALGIPAYLLWQRSH